MSKSTESKNIVEEIDDVIPSPTPVDEAKAACPKLLPMRALDPQFRLSASAELASALSAFDRLDGADFDSEDLNDVDGMETTAEAMQAMAQAVGHAREFLRLLAKRQDKFDRWVAKLGDDVYSGAILDLFTEQVQLVGKSSGSDGS